MNHERVRGLLLLAVTAACSLPLGLRLGNWCIDIVMEWCEGQPRMALVAIGLVLLPLLGSLLLGAWAGISQLRRTARLLAPLQKGIVPTLPSNLQTVSQQVGLDGKLDLVVMSFPFVCCYGLFRPRICVTTGLLALLTPRELAAVLQHERAHLQRRDPLRAWLWTVCDGVCWWSPRVSEIVRMRHELAADQEVIQAGQHHALVRAILKLIDHVQHRPSVSNTDLAISRLSITEARIDQLLQPERPASLGSLALRSRLAPLASLIILAACLVTMAGLQN